MKRLLRKVAEECGELTQAAIKVHDGGDWLAQLTDEAGDVIAAINKLVTAGVIDRKKLKQRIKDKT